jgi:hypothetical protein
MLLCLVTLAGGHRESVNSITFRWVTNCGYVQIAANTGVTEEIHT